MIGLIHSEIRQRSLARAHSAVTIAARGHDLELFATLRIDARTLSMSTYSISRRKMKVVRFNNRPGGFAFFIPMDKCRGSVVKTALSVFI